MMNKRVENIIVGAYHIGAAQMDWYIPNIAYECAHTIGCAGRDEDQAYEYYRALLHRVGVRRLR